LSWEESIPYFNIAFTASSGKSSLEKGRYQYGMAVMQCENIEHYTVQGKSKQNMRVTVVN